MSNSSGKVVQLRPKKADPTKQKIKPDVAEETTSKHKNVSRIAQLSFVGLATVLRYVLFFVLKALRTPIRICCGLLTFAAIIGLPLAFFGYPSGDPTRSTMLVVLGVGLVASQAISWFYDSLLLGLSPEPMYIP